MNNRVFGVSDAGQAYLKVNFDHFFQCSARLWDEYCLGFGPTVARKFQHFVFVFDSAALFTNRAVPEREPVEFPA